MADRISYSGTSHFQLREFILRLLERHVSFNVDFPKDGCSLWELVSRNSSAKDADILKEVWNSVKYKKLKITATDPNMDIYLSDEDGALVQHEKGIMNTSIMGGTYYISFGLHDPNKREIDLNEDMEVRQ